MSEQSKMAVESTFGTEPKRVIHIGDNIQWVASSGIVWTIIGGTLTFAWTKGAPEPVQLTYLREAALAHKAIDGVDDILGLLTCRVTEMHEHYYADRARHEAVVHLSSWR